MDVFKLLNLTRCESVLYRNAAIIKPAHREAALDCKESIQLLLQSYEANGLTLDNQMAFLLLEQFLMELSGDVSKTPTQDQQKIREAYNARRYCHSSYSTEKTTKKASKRLYALLKGAA